MQVALGDVDADGEGVGGAECIGDAFGYRVRAYNLAREPVEVVIALSTDVPVAEPDQLVLALELPKGIESVNDEFPITDGELASGAYVEHVVDVHVKDVPRTPEVSFARLETIGDVPIALADGVEGDLEEPTLLGPCEAIAPSTTLDEAERTGDTEGEGVAGASSEALFVILDDRAVNGQELADVPCGDGRFAYQVQLYNRSSVELDVLLTTSSEIDGSGDRVVLRLELPDGVEAVDWSDRELTLAPNGELDETILLPVRVDAPRDDNRTLISELVPQGDIDGLPVRLIGDLAEPTAALACEDTA